MIKSKIDQKPEVSKEYSILQKFPKPALNNTNVRTLGNSNEPIEVFPPEIFFKDIEPNQNYEVTVTVRNISKKVRRIKFSKPGTKNFKCDYDMQGPVAAGLAIKMNVSFETDAEGDFHDTIEITTEDHGDTYKLYLHALKPAPDIQFEPLVNFKFIPINQQKTQEIEFKNEGRVAGTVNLSFDPKSQKNTEIKIDPQRFSLEPDEIKKVEITLQASEPDFLMKLIQVQVEGQDRIRNIEVTATSVEHHLSIVFDEGGGQKSSLNFGTLYMGERREYPGFLVNNGPTAVNFEVKFQLRMALDDVDVKEDDTLFQSPSEMGKEQADRVLTTEPLAGVVAPYSQMPIKFVCRTKKADKIQGFSDHVKRVKPYPFKETGMSGNEENEEKFLIKPTEYKSLAVIGFIGNESHEALKVQMMAKACYPQIKINKQSLQFGECATNERKDFNLTIKNKNEDLPLDFNFSKIAHFHAYPGKGKLLPGTKHPINVSFEPKNFGVFTNTIELEILGGVYKIPIKIMGSSSSQGQKEKQLRGPQASKDDFKATQKFITDSEADHPQIKSRATMPAGETDMQKWLQQSTTMNIDSQLKIENTDKIDDYLKRKQNNTVYNEFLKTQRQDRKHQEVIQRKVMQNQRPLPQTIEDIEKDADIGMDNFMEPPKLGIPTTNDPLFVMKPIGNYDAQQPLFIVSKDKQVATKQGAPGESAGAPEIRQRQKIDENRIIKKKWKPEPTTQAELRDCRETLTGEQLQKIGTGPKKLDFKTVFVKSTVTKSFIVTNDLRQHIHVKLIIEEAAFQKSTPLSQVIPPGQEAGFDIVFCSSKQQSYTKKITYYINEVHQFNFAVIAQADPVTLDFPKKQIKFSFGEENTDMSCTEKIIVTNNGNAPAKYKWQYKEAGVFIPSPVEGEVPPGEHRECRITFTPVGFKSVTEEDTLSMKIEDGLPNNVQCIGVLNEAKILFQEKVLEFGNVPVGLKSKEMIINLQNKFRYTAVFQVINNSEELIITPMKDRISGDGKKVLTCSFLSNIEKTFTSEIILNVRGGEKQKLIVKANAIIPEVKIEEDSLDFGGVTFGDTKTLPLTLHNDSNIDAKLILDLRDYPEFEIIMPQESVDDDVASEIMVPIPEEINYGDLDNINPDDIRDNDEEEGEEEDEKEEENKRHVYITLKPGKSPLRLQLKYTPCDVDDPRNFEIPLKLAGVGEIEGLTRTIKGVGVKPRFLLEPTNVNFNKQVIAKGSKPLPFNQEVTISNPDHLPIVWSVDRDQLDKTKVFSMNPTEGRLEPGTTSVVRVTFNPLEPQVYSAKIPLYLDNDKIKPYLMIEFKGEGNEAKIFFNMREVILPCVPLGIAAKATFKVCHNGYENLQLRPRIATEVGKLPIDLKFPDGQNLGVTKKWVFVEAHFMNKKPLSFTTHIDFFDDEGNKFSIPISGTTDNSLFTVYAFLQRNPDEIAIEQQGGKPIMLIEDASSDKESGKTGMPGKAFSKGTQSVISRTAKSIVGYNPVPQNLLEKNCEYITRWFNSTLQNSSMQNFPQDIINQNGAQIFDLIAYLSGKKAPGQPPKGVGSTGASNAKDNLKVLMTQYEELINYLKVNGAHLNTVRPEFLLSINDYIKFLKMYPKDENMKPKQIERIFPYMQMESWITMFYQILKIYYLNRVTPKSFKSLPGMPSAEASIEPIMMNSNIYSTAETILLKWMLYHYHKMNPTMVLTLNNFEDLNAQENLASVFAALIKSHFGNAKSLKDVKQGFTDEGKLFNARKIIEAVSEIGLQTHLVPNDIINPSGREIFLFVSQLYQGLPHYIAKATISFPCVLGEGIEKNIELSNPSKNAISYWVKLEGCSDFSIQEDTVRIEPGNTENFPIRFDSRISAPVTAKIVFTNKKEGNVQAAAMVFELVSDVHSRKTKEEKQVTTKLYSQAQVELLVGNDFGVDVNFQVQVIYKRPEKPQNKKKENQKPGGKKGAATEVAKRTIPEPFFTKQDQIRIRKNGNATVNVFFLPFELGVHSCYVVFIDETVGELQYEIVGQAVLPESIPEGNDNKKCNAEETVPIEIVVTTKNAALEKARNLIGDRGGKKDQTTGGGTTGGSRAVKAPDSQFFEIEISNPFFTGPNSITVVDPSKTMKQVEQQQKQVSTPKGKNQSTMMSGADDPNKLTLMFSPNKPAKYQCYVILKSLDRTDIRVYEITMTAIPQMIKAQLEFRVPARGQVAQEIPIHNNSDKDWNLKGVLTYDQNERNGRFDLAKKDIVVKRKSQENFVLKFVPTWTCVVVGKLQLTNSVTNEVYEYELKGIGEEPLAEDHIILNCKAREVTIQTFTLENKGPKQLGYTVWTDLQNAEGKKEFQIKPNDKYTYELKITPLLGGVYTASITFQDTEERFIWWTVEVRTDSPRPEATITLQAFIRKAATADITLTNPLNEPISFEVFYSGEGLLGDSNFSLEPKSNGIYNLIFSPLSAGEYTGTIGFLNEKVGEFWYDLNLIAEENPIQNLELLECELGKIVSHYIQLENPTGQELFIEYRNSNPTNYEVIPEKIVLPPYEAQKVCIQYSPSNLDVVESGQIIFENQLVGKWEYHLDGKGMVPTIMEPSPISTSVGNNTSSMLTFKNPFREASTVQIAMETEDSKIFSLLLKRNKFNIGPLGILQIPYSFSPQTMTESKATIMVSMTKQLTWRYPLRGIAESASTQIDYHFKTKARKPIEEKLSIQLPGFEDLSPDDTFRYEINVANPQHKGFIERSVFFEQNTERLENAHDPISFLMRFEPLRPFKTTTEFMIYKSSGGRWKFNVVFEALDPEVDDTIIIQSPLHKTSSVSFKLTNHMKTFAEFQAYFTPDSAPEFVVYPKTGLLEPYGKDGTNFIVSFTPTEYGKAKIGKLVIQTEEMQWTYEIRGSHPQYKIPEVGGGRINNKLSREIVETIKKKQNEKKNFLRENLKTNQKAPGTGSPSRLAGGASVMNVSQRGQKSRAGAYKDHSNERSQYLKQ